MKEKELKKEIKKDMDNYMKGLQKEKELSDDYLKGWCDGKREGQNSQKEKDLKIMNKWLYTNETFEELTQKIKGDKE